MKRRDVFIVACFLLLLDLLLVFVDYSKVKNGEEPVFSIKLNSNDKDSVSYLGFLYRFKYKNRDVGSNNVRFTYLFVSFDIEQNNSLGIKTVEKKSCDKTRKLYFSKGSQKFYTYCLDEVYVNKSDKTEKLSEYLKANDNIDELLSLLTIKNQFWDGGSTLYKSKERNIAILTCKTVGNNNDVYIGPYAMDYEDSFCKDSYKKDEEVIPFSKK